MITGVVTIVVTGRLFTIVVTVRVVTRLNASMPKAPAEPTTTSLPVEAGRSATANAVVTVSPA